MTGGFLPPIFLKILTNIFHISPQRNPSLRINLVVKSFLTYVTSASEDRNENRTVIDRNLLSLIWLKVFLKVQSPLLIVKFLYQSTRSNAKPGRKIESKITKFRKKQIRFSEKRKYS